MFKWINKCMNQVTELDDMVMGKCKKQELTVDVARANYQEYLEDLKNEQKEYKFKLCDEIKYYSRQGFTNITTACTNGMQKFITKDYLNDLKVYFDTKGFSTRIIEDSAGDTYLRISWG